MGVTLTTEMINGAMKYHAEYGVPASVTLAQIMLESGGSNPGGLSDLAYKDNNLFGIKAGSSWTGQTSTYKTQEYINGEYVTVDAAFRKYGSIEDSIKDHAILLSSNLYTSKTSSATNLTEYVNAMGSVYATDPNYASKVLSIISDNHLERYDFAAYDGTGSAVSGESTNGFTNVNSLDEPNLSASQEIMYWVGKVIALLFLCFLGVVFFMRAFDIKTKGVKSNE